MPVAEIIFAAAFISAAILGVLGLFWFLFVIIRRPLKIERGGIRIGAVLFPHDFAIDSLLLAEAQAFDVGKDGRFARTVRLYFGFSFPQREVGWFRLANGQDACVHIWKKSRALYIPKTDGRAIVLGLDDPEGMLASLTRMQT